MLQTKKKLNEHQIFDFIFKKVWNNFSSVKFAFCFPESYCLTKTTIPNRTSIDIKRLKYESIDIEKRSTPIRPQHFEL